MADEPKIPAGRFARAVQMGRLSARLAATGLAELADRAGRAAGRAVGVRRDAPSDLLVKLHTAQAEALLAELANMKGLAMKAGQLLSYVDGLVPEEYAPLYRKTLRALQDKAPHFPPDSVRAVVEAEFGRPPEALFRRFDPVPLAAASIGQVHRAELPDGTPVAVKIQYPGVDAAVLADLSNARVLETVMGPLAGRFQVGEVLDEVVATIAAEVDYLVEAKAQMRFRAAWAGERGFVIPQVYGEFSTRRVLTSDFVEGRSFHAFVETAGPAERQRAGLMLFRFVYEGLFLHGLFNADPHPGNYLFLDDGRIAFIDFGCTKAYGAAFLRDSIDFYRTLLLDDDAAIDAAGRRLFRIAPGDDTSAQILIAYVTHMLSWLRAPGAFVFTPAFVRSCVEAHKEMATALTFRTVGVPPIPPEFFFLSRLQFGFFSILAALGARGHFRETVAAVLDRAEPRWGE